MACALIISLNINNIVSYVFETIDNFCKRGTRFLFSWKKKWKKNEGMSPFSFPPFEFPTNQLELSGIKIFGNDRRVIDSQHVSPPEHGTWIWPSSSFPTCVH